MSLRYGRRGRSHARLRGRRNAWTAHGLGRPARPCGVQARWRGRSLAVVLGAPGLVAGEDAIEVASGAIEHSLRQPDLLGCPCVDHLLQRRAELPYRREELVPAIVFVVVRNLLPRVR